MLSLLLISRIIPTRTSSCKFSRYQLTDSHGLNDNTKSLRTSMALDILPDDLGKGRGQSRGIGATQVEATSVARGMPLDCLMFLSLTLALALRVETCQGFRASESLRLSVRTIGNWIYHSPAAAGRAVHCHLPSTQNLLRSLKVPSIAPSWAFQTGCTAPGELVVTQMDRKDPHRLSPLAKLLPLGIRCLSWGFRVWGSGALPFRL